MLNEQWHHWENIPCLKYEWKSLMATDVCKEKLMIVKRQWMPPVNIGSWWIWHYQYGEWAQRSIYRSGVREIQQSDTCTLLIGLYLFMLKWREEAGNLTDKHSTTEVNKCMRRLLWPLFKSTGLSQTSCFIFRRDINTGRLIGFAVFFTTCFSMLFQKYQQEHCFQYV